MIFRKTKLKASSSASVACYEPFEGEPADSDLFKLFIAPNDRVTHKWVHYFEVYERYFAKFRGQAVNILEIGVFRGGTLQLWKHYFGHKAKIFGVDINPDCKRFEEENIRIFIGDQANRTFLRTMIQQLPPIDIVIDDGGHMSKQQIISFEELYPCISPHGIYVVEDTHTNYWPRYNRGAKTSFMNYAKKRVDDLHAWHFSKSTHKRFAIHPNDRQGALKVSDFTRQTKSIHFYNSMVVFEKCPVSEPYHCYSNVKHKKKKKS